MKYIYFLIGIIFYAGFAFDIEVDRDVGTWFWLLISVYFFFNSYLHYKKDKFINGISKEEIILRLKNKSYGGQFIGNVIEALYGKDEADKFTKEQDEKLKSTWNQAGRECHRDGGKTVC